MIMILLAAEGGEAAAARVRPRQGLLSELLSGAQPIATTALWIAMLLTGYVLAYYF